VQYAGDVLLTANAKQGYSKMNTETFVKLLSLQERLENVIRWGKNQEYTQGNVDRLKNFYRSAEESGIHPLQVCYLLFKKHCDSVASFAIHRKTFSSEPIQGRIADVRNYAILFQAIVEDLKNRPDLPEEWKIDEKEGYRQEETESEDELTQKEYNNEVAQDIESLQTSKE